MADLMMQSKSGEFVAKKAIPVGYKMTEVGVIPEDWDVVSVSSLISSIGSGVSVNSVDKINAFSHGMHVLKTSCVSEGEFLPDEKKSILPSDIHRAKCSPSKGDIIVSRMNTPMLVGELGYVSVDIEDSFLPDRLWLMKFKNSGDVNSRWLSLLLSSSSFSKKIKESATGTSGSMKNISKETFLAMLVPKPAFKEQAIIATTLADTDSLIAGLDQLVAKKQAIKTATMQQLLTGRTRLPQFALRPDGTPKGYKSSELGQIPEDWVLADIRSISAVPMQNGLFYEPIRKGKGVPLINVGDMYTAAPVDVGLLELFDASLNEIKLFKAVRGDLFFTRSSVVPSGIAYCNIFDSERNDVVFDSHLIRVRPNVELVDPKYLYLSCISKYARSALIAEAKTATMTTIDQGAINSCPVLVPPKNEQTAIATILSDMDNELQALTQKLEKARALKQGMMQQLLTGRIRLPLEVVA
ncbi:restriction endonuclease subunit S [Aeromonas caviae]|uniref:restriction endonuclease subunit S n=1 Tax=Aeromonas caviae TaxID=648 RepID=UPI003F749E41